MNICDVRTETFEFFQGAGPKIYFRLAEAIYDYSRGVVVPRGFINLDLAQVTCRIASEGIVFVSRDAVIDPDQTNNPGKAYLQMLPSDTASFTETVYAEMQIKLIPPNGYDIFIDGPKLIIKENLF